jgi:RNA polymerase sigma factor for flagellar operon FliA
MLVEYLPLIRRVVESVARRHGAAAHELFSDVCLKLLEQDCTVLRQYRGECSFKTYLRVVVCRVLLDQRVRAWGKWRPSVRARALGETGILLEQLIVRDGMTVDEAVAIAFQRRGSSLDRDQIVRFCATIKPRRRRAPVGLDEIGEVADGHDLVSAGGLSDLQRQAAALGTALRTALNSLGVAERELLSWRFRDGRTVAEIARATGSNQKRLYRMYESIFLRLRNVLERAGVEASDVREVLGDSIAEVGRAFSPIRSAA